jgi:hypothetical protein
VGWIGAGCRLSLDGRWFGHAHRTRLDHPSTLCGPINNDVANGPQNLDINYPSPMLVYALVLVTYFMVTAGIAYDIINEPPAVGATTDPVTGQLFA